MEKVETGGDALPTSRIGYGCASLAGWDRKAPDGERIRRAERAIDAALAQGITLFDHADIYGFGHAEWVFGRILRDRPGLRETLTIQTKCGQSLGEDWAPGKPIGVDLRHEHIVRAAEASLVRLGIERIDLLLLHSPSPLAEPEEIARAFDSLHRAGKVRRFGTSNFLPPQLALLERATDQPLSVNQIRIGLSHPHALCDGMAFPIGLRTGRSAPLPGMDGVLDHCRLRGIQIQAWSPLQGIDTRPGALLERIADRLGATPHAVALAWLLRHPAGIVPILGSMDPANIAANCAGLGLALRDEDWLDLLAEAATRG